MLCNVLPQAVKSIIVTGTEFSTIWFHEIIKMAWEYVGRIHNQNYVKLMSWPPEADDILTCQGGRVHDINFKQAARYEMRS